jgi:hypothetical protein
MHKTPQAVKATAPNGPNARRQRRYDKLVITIERRERKLDKDQRSVARGIKALAKMQRDRMRLRKAIDRAERDAADALVASTVAPTPQPQPEPLADFVQRGQAAQAAVDDILNRDTRGTDAPTVKPRRPRKPTVAEGVAAILGEAIGGGAPKAESREARMQAMGFRKTGKRR